jgi:hypothetical protein
MSLWIACSPILALIALKRLHGGAADDGRVVAGEAVLVEELADLHLDELEELGVVERGRTLFRKTTMDGT